MTPSAHCLAIIEHCEGERLTAYRDSGGVLTIGVGHTGSDVAPGQTITAQQAEALLRRDLQSAANAVTAMGGTCTQNQFDALVSLAFNIGSGALAGSTLLHLHKQGQYAAAAGEFGKWCHDSGAVQPGLVKRRAYEALLYLGEPVL